MLSISRIYIFICLGAKNKLIQTKEFKTQDWSCPVGRQKEMIAKSSLTILFLMLITCLRRSSSMSLRLAQICQRHQDCGLFSICENGWCRPIRSLTDLEKKKPVVCATFFKAPCSSDTDCFCKAGSMICEANECVVRSTLNSSNDFKK